jgi:hypothetical protein
MNQKHGEKYFLRERLRLKDKAEQIAEEHESLKADYIVSMTNTLERQDSFESMRVPGLTFDEQGIHSANSNFDMMLTFMIYRQILVK